MTLFDTACQIEYRSGQFIFPVFPSIRFYCKLDKAKKGSWRDGEGAKGLLTYKL
jgi:hypothetical protein